MNETLHAKFKHLILVILYLNTSYFLIISIDLQKTMKPKAEFIFKVSGFCCTIFQVFQAVLNKISFEYVNL